MLELLKFCRMQNIYSRKSVLTGMAVGFHIVNASLTLAWYLHILIPCSGCHSVAALNCSTGCAEVLPNAEHIVENLSLQAWQQASI